MFDTLLPPTIDNTYGGHKVALWLFGLVVLLKLAMSLNIIFNGHYVAATADGIPLDKYPPAAAGTIVSFFALWGLWHLLFCALCILAFARYRSMIPLMFALLLLEHLGRKLILQIMPIARTVTTSASAINLTLLALMIAGLALSLWSRK